MFQVSKKNSKNWWRSDDLRASWVCEVLDGRLSKNKPNFRREIPLDYPINLTRSMIPIVDNTIKRGCAGCCEVWWAGRFSKTTPRAIFYTSSGSDVKSLTVRRLYQKMRTLTWAVDRVSESCRGVGDEWFSVARRLGMVWKGPSERLFGEHFRWRNPIVEKFRVNNWFLRAGNG